METKKILVLCFLGDPTLPAGSLLGTGGYNASVKDVFDFLCNTPQFECIFVTNTTGNYTDTSSVKINKNISLHRLYSSAANLLHKNDYTLEIETFITEVESIVKDFSQISFIHSFYWLSGLIASVLSEKYQLPFIHTTVSLSKQKLIAGYQPAITQQLEYENDFLQKAKYVLAITEEEKRILIEHYRLSEEKIIVEGQNISKAFHEPLYNNYGLPQDIFPQSEKFNPIGFNELGISDAGWWNAGAFTYVGRIIKAKGLDIIINAWITLDKYFHKSIPPLWIIGNTPYEINAFREKLDIPLNLLSQYENSRRIVWWGYLDPIAISTIYLKTAVLITHSAFEGGGRVILEAMCQGIPVISTNTGFGKDYVKDWINGFVVEYGDIDNLMLRMSHFVSNATLSSVLGQNSKVIFREIEAHQNHNACINDLYTSLHNNCNYSKVCACNLNLCDTVFEKGIVTTFPYYYHKPTLKELSQFVNTAVQKKAFTKESDYREIRSRDVWVYKEKYVVKNIYPKLNKRKLWDASEVQDVWATTEMINKYYLCMKSSVVLTPISISKEKLLMVLPYMAMLSYSELKTSVYNIAIRLKMFSDLPAEDVIATTSFVSYWENLKKSIYYLHIEELLSLYDMLPPSVNKFLSTPENFIAPMRLQYAQSILDHIGIYENLLYILPTYKWRYLQCGYDAAQLFYETLTLSIPLCISESCTMLCQFSHIWEVSVLEIIGWSLCICFEHMIHDILFQEKKLSCIKSIYLHLIELMESFI